MSDRRGYAYSDRARYEISVNDLDAYGTVADALNRDGYDVLSVQHEYGIFGGSAGCDLLNLVRRAKMPITTTLHTVLSDPSDSQKAVMDELLQISSRVVVMSRKAIDMLQDVHQTPVSKIDLIPHGIPKIHETTGQEFRTLLDIDGPMILTFGLLSPDKGIQYAIRAMVDIVREHPGATYIVVGATHPAVQVESGETYRESLVNLACDLGVATSIRFVDRFVSIEELVQFLGAMDVYITPYLNPKQITSGTLAYAVGAGKAVISTPYIYAQEMLDGGRGMLVPFRNAERISDSVLALERQPDAKREMGRRAAEFGKQMLWPEVGKKYLASFTKSLSPTQPEIVQQLATQCLPISTSKSLGWRLSSAAQ